MLTVILRASGSRRPSYDSLQSVRAQTARDTISQVIVLTDGSATEGLQEPAGGLPITYCRDEAGAASGQWRVALKLVTTPLVAFLDQSDCWEPWHLEASIDALRSHLECEAVFADAYVAERPEHPLRNSRKSWRVWLAAGGIFTDPVIFLDETSTMLTCLLDSNFEYSTLVGRTEAVRNAHAEAAQAGEALDCERLVPAFLSATAKIAYLTRPSACVCRPPMPETAQDLAHSEKQAVTTRWLVKYHPERVARAAELFNRLVRQISRSSPVHDAFPSLPTVLLGIGGVHWGVLFSECGMDLISRERKVKDARWLLEQLCPPALNLRLQRRLEKERPFQVPR